MLLNLRKKILAIIFISLFLPSAIAAQNNPVDLYLFEGQGCPHCARMKSYLEGLKKDYPNLNVHDFEVYFNKENQSLFRKMAEAYKTDASGVPTIFIDNEVIIGENFEKVKNAVERCSHEACISPMEKLNQGSNSTNINISYDGYSPTTKQKSETIIGWIVIIFLIIVCLSLFYFLKRRRKNV
jgi:glutaredoxin